MPIMTSQIIFVVVILICIVGFTKSKNPEKPSSLTRTYYSTSIVLDWQQEVDQTYIVKVIPNVDGNIANCYDGEENAVSPFTVTNDTNGTPIQPRTKYDIGLCAGSIPILPNLDQTSMSDPFTVNAAQTGPRPPTNLRVSSFIDNEIFVEWDDTDDEEGKRAVTHYTVYYKPTTGGANEISIPTDDRTRSAILTGLQPNTEYNIEVASNTSDESRSSDRSSPITGTTTRPSKPTTINLDQIFSTSVETSWTDVTDALTYKAIAVKEDETITNCNGGEEVDSPQFTFINTSDGMNIKSRTAYNLGVCAVNANGGMSEPAVRTNVNTGPAPPTNLKSTGSTTNTLSLQWDDDDVEDVHPVIRYTVYYKPTSGGTEASESTTDRTQSITLTELQSNAEYTISVMSITSSPVAVKTSDRSSSINATAVPLPIPSPPENFQLDRIFSTSMETSWTEQKDLTYKAVASREEITDCGEGVTAESAFIFSKTSDGMNITSRMAYNLAVCAVNYEGKVGDPSFIYNAGAGPPPPTNLKTTGSTNKTLSLQWDDDDVADVHPVIQYTVYYKPTSGGTEESENTTDRTRNITITGLQSNTEYTISVMSITSNDNKTSDRSSSISGITVPIQANSPDQSAVTNFSISLSWDEAIENDALKRNYTVSWIPSSISNVSSLSAGTSTSITIDDLSSNKEYEFKLTAYNVAGSGEPSTGVAYATVPARANDPNRTNASSSSISLSWVEVEEDPALERNYTVSWTSLTRSDVSATSNSTSTSIIVYDLSSNNDYEFILKANNLAGSGEPSNAVRYATVPLQLSSPNSRNVTNASVLLQWTEIEEGPLYKTYIVACSSVDHNDVRGGDRINETSFQVDDLMSNSEYSCTVAAETKGGKGLPSPSTPVITFPGNPSPPTNSTTATTATISLQWEEVDNGSVDKTYLVRWHSNEGTGYKPDISSTSTTITGLNPSTSYTFSLMASNEAGNSSLSTEEIFLTVPDKTKDTNLSSVPTNPTTTLVIEWSKPDGGEEIDGYLVEWMLSSGPYVDSKDVPHNNENISYSQTIGSLTPGETYNVSVKAFNSANRGEPEIRNKTTVPEIVVGLTPTQSTSNPTTRIKLTWSTVGAGDSIQVFYNSTTTETYYGPVFFPLKNNEGEIEVEPGNNYSISVRTSSKDLLSREDESTKVTINSEPDQVVITNITQAATSLTVYWNQPAGYIEGYTIRISDNSIFVQERILDNNATSYQADGLSPNTDYSVSLQSWITDIEGKPNYSEAPPPEQVTTISDRPASPPAPIWIVGVVLGLLAVVIIVVGGVYYYKRRKSNKNVDELSMPPRTTAPSTIRSKPVISKKVKVSDFDAHVKKMHADSNLIFANEYQEFLSVGRDQSVDASSLPENRPKNRYKNILAYDISRVRLAKKNEDPGSDYINANYIPGNNNRREYIATQGPLAGTKDDFWRLVWEQNSRVIVMVTQVVESGKSKCIHYWPEDNTPVKVDGLKISLTSEIVSPDWTIREFDLSNGSEARTIKQFHYTAWPDHGVPQTTRAIVRFVWKVRQTMNEEMRHNTGPATVHCSAGVGRTGTFIAIDRLLQTLRTESTVDIYGIVHQMRMHRMFMVQTESQYVLLHKMVQDIANKLYDAYDEVDPIYANATDMEPVYENTAFQSDGEI